jgi:hypothetical protein
MNPLALINPRSRAGSGVAVSLLVGLLLASAPARVSACFEIPHAPPPIWVTTNNNCTIKLTFHDYTTYAATMAGDYCACALNLPFTYGNVLAAKVVMAGTQTPLPNFSFTFDPDSGNGYQAISGTGPWTGFSSAVAGAINANIPIDLCFDIQLHPVITNDQCGTIIVNWANIMPAVNCISNHLASTPMLVGTGGAFPNGAPDPTKHLSINRAGPIMVMLGAPIPTISQWGLIILALLLLTVGTVCVHRRQASLELAGGMEMLQDRLPLVVPGVLAKSLLVAMAVASVGGAGFVLVVGSISLVDVLGTLVCAAIVGYWSHLLISSRNLAAAS